MTFTRPYHVTFTNKMGPAAEAPAPGPTHQRRDPLMSNTHPTPTLGDRLAHLAATDFDGLDRALRDLRAARVSTRSEMTHAERMGRPTASYRETIRRLDDRIHDTLQAIRKAERGR